MKKSILFFVVLLMMQSAIAIETNLEKSYMQGETIIIKISGNIIEPFLPGQVKFIRAGHVQEIPTISDLKKIGDVYYLWALAPKSPGNYTLVLNDLTTTVSGSPKKVEFRQNFSIESNLTDYGISPGFIISEKDFSIQAQLYLDKEIKINVDYPSKREVTLKPGNNILDFKIEGPSGIRMISVGKYSIPANILSGAQGSVYAPYSFAPNYLTKTFYVKEKNKTTKFRIINTGENDIKDIQIIHGDYFTVYPAEKITLKAKESKDYTLTVLKTDGIRLQDQISARSGEWNIVLPIKIDFDEELNDTLVKKNEDYRCSELGGKICADSQQCIGTLNSSQEGICCIGNCVQKPDDNKNESSIIGYIIAVLVIVGLILLYWKYKKVKPDQNPLHKKIKEAENVP